MSARPTRRTFLTGSMAAFGASLLAARSPFAALVPRRPVGRSRPAQEPLLLVVQLRGGNDGLNTVVPYTDPRYRSLRPTLALAEEDLLPLDGALALHPSLAPLLPWWERGRMAVVEGVGYPDPDLSHFRSEAIWYTADPVAAAGDGWLGAVTAARPAPGPAELVTVGVGPSPATSAAGYVPAAVRDPDTFGWDLLGRFPEDVALREALIHEGFVRALDGGARPVAEVGLAAEALVALVAGIPEEAEPPVPYPETELGADLAAAVRLLAAGIGVRVAWVATGGFDTHADQAFQHGQLLAGVAEGVAAALADLEARGLAGRAAVLVWSEFGRRPQENGSLGTDHGTAAPVFLLGEPVTGGVVGPAPDLADLDRAGNLRFAVDFRSVYASVLDEHLGEDPEPVLGGEFPRLGLFG